MMAHIRHVVQALRSPTSKSPSSDAVAHVLAVHDRTVPKQAEKLLACRKGCSHCCSQMVVVTAPEAFYVAAQLRSRPEAAAAVAEVARQAGAMTLEQRLGKNIFCPLLTDTICSIYAGRPLGCRGFVSTNLDACIAAFTRGETPDIPMPNDSISVLYACRMLLLAALRVAGLKDGVYEMNSAVAVALGSKDAESQWLAGKDLFAGLQASPPPPPQFESAIRQMVAHIGPTV
ncbi:MAG: YkgJ family cysteine cluster protein [Rhodospirillaceae bacterium]